MIAGSVLNLFLLDWLSLDISTTNHQAVAIK